MTPDEEDAERAGWNDFQRAVIGFLGGTMTFALAIAGSVWFWYWG